MNSLLRRWLAHPLMRGWDVDNPLSVSIQRQVIREKPFLRRLYEEWYEIVEDELPGGRGRILEIGSGAGFLRARLPSLIASDLFAIAGLDAVLDAQRLPLADSSLRAIVMTDAFHHLPEPRRFLQEAARVVRPGGRLIAIEPWVSRWSRFVYGRFHHEPFEPNSPNWEFPPGGPLSTANGALPWIVFERDRQQFEREFPEWRIVSVRPFMPFRYLLSGGVSLRPLTPAGSFGAWRRLEQLLQPWMRQLAMFAVIVVERS